MKFIIVVDEKRETYAIENLYIEKTAKDVIEKKNEKGGKLSYIVCDAADREAAEACAKKKYPNHHYICMKDLLADPPAE